MALRALLLCRSPAHLSRSQIHPFRFFRSELSRELDLEVCELNLPALGKLDFKQANQYDLVFLQLKIGASPGLKFNDALRAIDRPKIVLDDRDSTGNCGFTAMKWCDLYVKNQTLIDRSQYALDFLNGRFHAEEIARLHDPSRPAPAWLGVPLQLENRLITGWNLGTAPELATRTTRASIRHRPIDVNYRADLSKPQNFWWYQKHRALAMQAVQGLTTRWTVVAEPKHLTRPDYQAELQQSKICVSPWGHGEVCYRDFEAILCGALLVKPVMNHLETRPNIFLAGRTYAPVQADFSDLAEVCEYYLAHPQERERMVAEAWAHYRAYFERAVFVDQMRDILTRLYLI